MIVIDYVDGRGRTERISDSSSTMMTSSSPVINKTITELKIHQHHIGANQYVGTFVDSPGSSVDDPPPPPPPRNHHIQYHTNGSSSHYVNGYNNNNQTKTGMRSSRSSDSSSAYSGSDTMIQAQQNGNSQGEVDLSGLMESVVDSDEEEDEEEESLIVRDAVRECLEKDPSDRNEEDIDVLLEFTQHLKAFTNMTLSVRRSLVATMVFAVVEKAGTVVMTDGEELDSWSVIINGHVEIQTTGGDVKELHLGDSFGITPTMEKLYHKGVMRTKCDDCQFVCVTQTDYYRILHKGQESQKRHQDENGDVVLVTEHRRADQQDTHRVAGDTHNGHVVIRGKPINIMQQLMEDNSDSDPTFVEDFLLTYRTFLHSPTSIMKQLLEWFSQAPNLRDKVTRVLLLWVNNHFTDFETNPAMMELLERFESLLEAEKMQGQLRMLNFACAAKARKRTVTLTRPSRDEPLHFSIMGGYERGFGIFVSKVEKGSKADEIGLKRGDQILEVNGQSFDENVTKHGRALEILKSVCHLSITVKSNLLAFNEMLQTPEDTPRHAHRRGLSEQSAYSGSEGHLSSFGSSKHHSRDTTPTKTNKREASLKTTSNHSKSRLLNKAFNRFLHKPKSLISMDTAHNDEFHNHVGYPSGGLSSPDLSRHHADRSGHDLDHSPSNHSTDDQKSEFPEHVLKVYKVDQTFKYLLVHKETTAHEVVMLSLQEFGITETSSNYALCEVSVSEGGFVKQRRLPDSLQNLAERIGLASRYYIKNIQSSEALLPDELAGELVKDAHVTLLQLNPVEVSTQLMVEDFTIFRQIEATEYVEDLFEIKSRYGSPSLNLFAELVNREMMWTISEIVSEQNATKRMRIIKQYIKVARQCKETQNFNSMFAIISGLGHGAVSRLKCSWEKLPTKYQRTFGEMQQLMDPSRNMSRYRNLVNGEGVQPPIIPFYPVVKKDLTFIHLANDSKIENLVNFEKLRMIAKEVRGLTNMCSAPLDLFSMLELGGQQPSNAMVAMNQLTAGGQYLATVNRRRKKANGLPNPKRMFEEAQMVRRVKAYLNNMKIITDEDKLHQMSLECEPPAGGIPTAIQSVTNQQSVRKRNASPTPSALSSTSSASHQSEKKNNVGSNQNVAPKFGASSPDSVKKLLSLSAHIRTRRPAARHRSPSSPLTSATLVSNNAHSAASQSAAAAAAASAAHPVDLTAESSSVSSLQAQPPTTKHNNGSVTSTDSGFCFLGSDHSPPNSHMLHHDHHNTSTYSSARRRTQQHASSPSQRKFLYCHVSSSSPTCSPSPVRSPDPLLTRPPTHTQNNLPRIINASSRLNAIPPLPPPKGKGVRASLTKPGAKRGTGIPTYYVTDHEEDEDDDETQVSAV